MFNIQKVKNEGIANEFGIVHLGKFQLPVECSISCGMNMYCKNGDKWRLMEDGQRIKPSSFWVREFVEFVLLDEHFTTEIEKTFMQEPVMNKDGVWVRPFFQVKLLVKINDPEAYLKMFANGYTRGLKGYVFENAQEIEKRVFDQSLETINYLPFVQKAGITLVLSKIEQKWVEAGLDPVQERSNQRVKFNIQHKDKLQSVADGHEIDYIKKKNDLDIKIMDDDYNDRRMNQKHEAQLLQTDVKKEELEMKLKELTVQSDIKMKEETHRANLRMTEEGLVLTKIKELYEMGNISSDVFVALLQAIRNQPIKPGKNKDNLNDLYKNIL